MSCLKVEDLYIYLENEISQEQRDKIQEHLKSCSRCQIILNDRKTYLESLGSLPRYELPSDFPHQVMTHLPEFRALPRILVTLIGGIFLLFFLIGVMAIIGIGRPFSSFYSYILKNIFQAVGAVSQFILQIFYLILGLIKAIKIIIEAIGNFLLHFLPKSEPAIITMIASVILSLFIFGHLINFFWHSCRRKNHEDQI